MNRRSFLSTLAMTPIAACVAKVAKAMPSPMPTIVTASIQADTIRARELILSDHLPHRAQVIPGLKYAFSAWVCGAGRIDSVFTNDLGEVIRRECQISSHGNTWAKYTSVLVAPACAREVRFEPTFETSGFVNGMELVPVPSDTVICYGSVTSENPAICIIGADRIA